jgi:hypothetical protein
MNRLSSWIGMGLLYLEFVRNLLSNEVYLQLIASSADYAHTELPYRFPVSKHFVYLQKK